MVDVDSISCWYGSLIATHCVIASILHQRDKSHRPKAYDKATFLSSHSSTLSPPETPITTTPVLSSIFITSAYVPSEVTNPAVGKYPTMSTSPTLFTSATSNFDKSIILMSNNNEIHIPVVARELFSDWLCINDTISSLLLWSQSIPPVSAV